MAWLRKDRRWSRWKDDEDDKEGCADVSVPFALKVPFWKCSLVGVGIVLSSTISVASAVYIPSKIKVASYVCHRSTPSA